MFLENKEITEYFNKSWKNFWKGTRDPEKRFQEKITRIQQVRDVLRLVKRDQDLQNIFYYDLELLTKIKKFLEYIPWFENAEVLIKKCKDTELNVKERPDFANSMFKDIISTIIIKEDSFLEKWKEFYKTNESHIRKIRIDKVKIPGIFPDDSLESHQDFVDCANNIVKAKSLLDRFPAYLRRYSELFNNS